MKVKVKHFLFLLLALVGTVSCGDDTPIILEPEINVEAKVHLDINSFEYDIQSKDVSNGDTLKVNSIELIKSDNGWYIASIDYSFDRKNIAFSTVAPFHLDYLIEGQTVGEHELGAMVKVIDGDSVLTANLAFPINVIK